MEKQKTELTGSELAAVIAAAVQAWQEDAGEDDLHNGIIVRSIRRIGRIR